MSNLNAFLNPASPLERQEVVVSKRFKREDGSPAPFVIRPLSQGENDELIRKSTRRVKVNGQLRMEFVPISCQHCTDAPCETACPTQATYIDKDTGTVLVDYDRCIGCRMCMAACPYNARTFNWNEPVRATGAAYGDARVPERGRGVMEKCTLCKERTDEGEVPMCVHCCPGDARIFGDLDDPDSAVSRLRREGSAEVLLEDKGTRPQVFYVR